MSAKQAFAVELAVPHASLLGESPFWHPDEAALYWVDIPGRRLQRYHPASGDLRHWEFDTEPGSCAPALGGGLVLAMRDGIWLFDPGTGRRHEIAAAPYDPSVERFNDGKCDAQGRFWVGTIYEPRDAPNATLHCLAQGVFEKRAGGVTVANGLAFSPDGRTLLWADTAAHAIDAFDVDPLDASLSRRRPFARFEPKPASVDLRGYGGRPDGAAMDAEGACWVAMFEGQRLVRLSSSGNILQEVPLPVRCPTMPCFGGADLKTLFITTARKNRPAAELANQPWAGCVLSMRVDVPGLPTNFYLR